MRFVEFYLQEKKDHLIKRIKNLNDDQKNELINFFNKNPHLENKIDWNNINTLTYDDFKPLFDVRSKTSLVKNVKEKGISGLIEGKDYVKFPISKGVAYIPLTYEASKLIASNRIGSCEGKWCTAYQKTDEHWVTYVIKNKIMLIYILLDDTKYAVAVYPDNTNIEIFDTEDERIHQIPEIDIEKEFKANLGIIDKARKYIQDNVSVYDKFGIKNYKENADGTVDVNGDVAISSSGLEKIPFKFGKVSGHFLCDDNQLKTLEGAPRKVGGNFNCRNNPLTSLEGAPRKVGGDFDCDGNQLISLDGAPQKVEGNFNCEENQLISLDGAPQKVEGNFNCSNNELISLEGAPTIVRGSFGCKDNELISLEGAPVYVGYDFDCRENELTTLEYAPRKVIHNFYCWDNITKFTESDVRKVSEVIGKIFT